MEKIECSKCHQKKPITEFNWRHKKAKIRQCRCRECTRQDSKTHYSTNPTHKMKVNEARIKRIAGNRKKILEYLKDNPCVDCGEDHPAALEFDHVKGEKKNNVSNMIHYNTWDKVAQEIEKCEVRCANCHNKKTAKERGYFTHI